MNKAWILMKMKQYVVQINGIIFHVHRFKYFQNGRRYDVITKNHGNSHSMLNKKDRDMHVGSECRNESKKCSAFLRN